MIEHLVDVAIIAAVVGYVEYRLRSYSALVHRFDVLGNRLEASVDSVADRLLEAQHEHQQSVATALDSQRSELVSLAEYHQAKLMDAERDAAGQMNETVGTALRTFNESVWRGVHNMAQTIQLPASPTFVCYYCGQTFPATFRERLGENDYCPEHGSKRQRPVEKEAPPPRRLEPVAASKLPWET